MLIDKPRSVGEVAVDAGIIQSGASQHLSVLTRAGVLQVENRGTQRVYSVRGPRIGKILSLTEEFSAAHGFYGDEPLEAPISAAISSQGV